MIIILVDSSELEGSLHKYFLFAPYVLGSQDFELEVFVLEGVRLLDNP